MSQCRYCDSTILGLGCSYCPNKIHEHNTDSATANFVAQSCMEPAAPTRPIAVNGLSQRIAADSAGANDGFGMLVSLNRADISVAPENGGST